MLPFLKKKQQTGVIVKTRQPDEKPEQEENEQEDQGLMVCAQDLIDAIAAQDVKAVASALRAAFQIADSEPHEEGEHTEPHSYDAQNEKAGE